MWSRVNSCCHTAAVGYPISLLACHKSITTQQHPQLPAQQHPDQNKEAIGAKMRALMVGIQSKAMGEWGANGESASTSIYACSPAICMNSYPWSSYPCHRCIEQVAPCFLFFLVKKTCCYAATFLVRKHYSQYVFYLIYNYSHLFLFFVWSVSSTVSQASGCRIFSE
jgi:hypothetical protein